VECSIDVRTTLQMMPSTNSLGRCCCTRTLPTTNSCPNSLDIPSHKTVTYSLGFGLVAQFDHPFADDRLNYDQMSPKRCVQLLPKASDKLQPPIRDDRLRNFMQAWHTSNVDLSILRNLSSGVNGYEVSGFHQLIYNHPNQIKLAGSQR
jgi:hypothetical protein